MTTKIYNQPIPEHKIGQFHEILCATGGRYLRNPWQYSKGCEYRVSYLVGDHEAMNKLWQDVTQGISETRKDQWWRKLLRRLHAPKWSHK